jgi:hypothetical protein
MIRVITAAALSVAALSAPASADGWSFTALEDGFDQDACMNRARAVLDIYQRRFGGQPERVESDWSVAAYSISGDVNTTFLCRTVGGSDPAWLITHSNGSGDDMRSTVHDRIRDIWNAPK